MKNILKNTILIIALLLLTGCPEDAKDGIVAYLTIKNNSNKDIVYLPLYIMKGNLNDTLLSVEASNWVEEKFVVHTLSSNNYRLKEYNKNAIETEFNLSIYFFDRDTLNQLEWEKIATENIILRRVDFHSWKELEDNNFELNYP